LIDPALFRRAAIGELIFRGPVADPLVLEVLERTRSWLCPRWIHSQGTWSEKTLEALLADTLLQSVRCVVFNGTGLGNRLARLLAKSESLAAVDRLNLGSNGITSAGASALAQAPFMAGLESLSLESNAVHVDGVRALMTLPRLAKLDLSGNPVGDAGAAAIAEAPSARALRWLWLVRSEIGATGVRRLAQTAALRHLERLALSHNPIDREDGEALAVSPYLPPGMTLHLDAASLGLSWEKFMDGPVVVDEGWSPEPPKRLSKRFNLVLGRGDEMNYVMGPFSIEFCGDEARSGARTPQRNELDDAWRVVRIAIKDGLRPNRDKPFVSEASYTMLFFCEVPEAWLAQGVLVPERENAILEQIFELLYGKGWREGNADGSCYVVLDTKLTVLDAAGVAEKPWLQKMEGYRNWKCLRFDEDGAFEALACEAFEPRTTSGNRTPDADTADTAEGAPTVVRERVHPVTVLTPASVPVVKLTTGVAAPELAYRPAPRNLVRGLALKGHTAFVQALAFAPDGAILVTGSEDGTVRLWNVATRDCMAVKRDHAAAVNCVSFTRDNLMLTASDDATVKVWSLPQFEVVQTLKGHTGYVSEAHAAGRGRALSSGDDGTLRLWDLATGECLKAMEHGEWPSAMHVAPDGKRAVACSAFFNVMKMWDLESGQVERVLTDAGGVRNKLGEIVPADNTSGVGHRSSARHILFSADGSTFATSRDEVILWDAETGAELRRVDGDGWWIRGFAFVPGTSQVFAAGMDAVRVFDLEARAIVAEATWAHDGDVHGVAVSPDGRWGASGSGDGTVGLWDMTALVASGRPDRHLSSPRSVAVSDDGRRALTSGADRSARLWDLEGDTNRAIRYDDGLFVGPVTFTPDGRLALVMTEQGVLRAYDATTGALHGENRREGGYSPFLKYCFLRDGSLLAGSASGPLVRWFLDSGVSFRTFDGEAGQVVGMAVDEAEDLGVTVEFGSGGFRLVVRYWSLDRMKLTREIEVDLQAYGTDVVITQDRVVIPTSIGVVLVLDRQGQLQCAVRAADTAIPDASLLADGRVGLGGPQPMLYDPVAGTILARLPLGAKQTAKTIRGTTRALVLDPATGVALLDYGAGTLSSFVSFPMEWVEASSNRRWAIGYSKSEELLGMPIVLRLPD
jgi:WD40 repeat protein